MDLSIFIGGIILFLTITGGIWNHAASKARDERDVQENTRKIDELSQERRYMKSGSRRRYPAQTPQRIGTLALYSTPMSEVVSHRAINEYSY